MHIIYRCPVVYRSRFQPTISQLSTDVEFIAVTEVGKLKLYLRSMLDYLYIHQLDATYIFLRIMTPPVQWLTYTALLGGPVEHVVLLDWVVMHKRILSVTSTYDNPTDDLTKYLGPHLFVYHSATLLGKRKPVYCTF